MMRMPSHAALCSFFFSVVLTSALVPSVGEVTFAAVGVPTVQTAVQSVLRDASSQGFAPSGGFTLPSPTATPSASPAFVRVNTASTTDFMAKMLRLIALKGVEQETAALFANALGLTPAGVPWTNHQVTAHDNRIASKYAFAVSRGQDQDIVLSFRHGDSVLGFRAHRDGTLVSAFSFDVQTKQLVPRTPSEAQADFSAQWKFWTDNADILIGEPLASTSAG